MDTMLETTPPLAPTPRTFGLLAEYDTPDQVLHAAELVRDAGYKKWDTHTPFPVHGMDKAMGIKPTILPWLVLCGGITGSTIALTMQWYVNSPSTAWHGFFAFLGGYPMVFSNKPYFPIASNIPVFFELTVLLSALTTFYSVWGLNRLPKYYHPLFTSERFRRVTDDKFFLCIEASDEKFDLGQTQSLLAQTHPVAIEEVKD
jgi:hypothetical protein